MDALSVELLGTPAYIVLLIFYINGHKRNQQKEVTLIIQSPFVNATVPQPPSPLTVLKITKNATF